MEDNGQGMGQHYRCTAVDVGGMVVAHRVPDWARDPWPRWTCYWLVNLRGWWCGLKDTSFCSRSVLLVDWRLLIMHLENPHTPTFYLVLEYLGGI